VQDRSVPVFLVFVTGRGGGGRGRVGTGTSVTVRFSVDFYPFRIPDPGPGSKRHQIQDGRYHSYSEFDKLVWHWIGTWVGYGLCTNFLWYKKHSCI
jgi:hypothetical protein